MIRSKKRAKASVFHPNDRKCRNNDPDGIAFMLWCKGLCCVVCEKKNWDSWIQVHRDDPEPPIWEVLKCEWDERPQSQFMHFDGTASAKGPNRNGLPGCEWHHMGHGQKLETNDSHEHLKGRFAAHHNLDTVRLIRCINRAYEAEKEACNGTSTA